MWNAITVGMGRLLTLCQSSCCCVLKFRVGMECVNVAAIKRMDMMMPGLDGSCRKHAEAAIYTSAYSMHALIIEVVFC